jgi:hypothetical protein
MLHLPVSLGEAIDKLTILDIKLDKITDNRRDDVKKEYDLLYDKLQEFIVKYENLYQIMKRVNLLIWDMMDILRDIAIDDDAQYLKICRDCIEYNDIRFRVKNKINFVSMSLLKEQKSYKINRMVIVLKHELFLHDVFAQIIKYFSFMYDEVNVVSDLSLDKLKETFSYDTTILFKPLSSPLLEHKKIYTVEHDDADLYKLFELDVARVLAFN